MSGNRLRWLGVGLLAGAGAGLLSLTSIMHSAYAYGDAVGLVIGGSGVPIPGPLYVDAANDFYIENGPGGVPTFPGTTYPGVLANGLFTPEGLYPLDGIKVLPLNYPSDATGFPAQSTSVGQGLTILDDNIKALTPGDTVTVFGYSQSATIASLEMQKLVDEHLGGSPVQFLLIGDPSAPNGGILERFNGFETTAGDSHVLPLNLASLGFSFDGATPDADFHTAIYSMEYDGFTDFPRYPLNFLADLNAFLGIKELHGTYLNTALNELDPSLKLPPGPTSTQIADATLLPGSMDSTMDPCTDHCLTNYYMIPEQAPLVAMLPKPLQDLLGPDLTYLINLGYGADNLGYSDAPANMATPFGLFPDVSSTTVFNQLVAGAEQGWTAFMKDLSDPSTLSWAMPSVASDAVAHVTATTMPSFTDIVNALSSAASEVSGAMLGLSDVANSLSTSLPAYDLSLFTENLQAGDLTDAFGLPMAANTAMYTLAGGFGLQIITNALSAIQADFASIGL